MFQANKIYTTKEFVQELGISFDTWKRKESRTKYLEYLEDFISYKITVKGRSNFYHVLEVYADYVKPNFRKQTTILNDVRENFKNVWKIGEPETSTRVAAIMIQQNLVDSNSQGSVRNKVSDVRTEKYGKPGSIGGPEGKCYYIRAKLFRNQTCPIGYDDDKRPIWDVSKFTYESLTPEDKKKLYEIHMKWYPNDIERFDNLREALESKEIKSLEEVTNYIIEKDLTQDERSQKFLEYTAELSLELQCDWIVRATVVEESIIPCNEDISSFSF